MKFKEPSRELGELGPGFLESTYEAALAIELELLGIQYSRQHPVGLHYKGHILGEGRLDLLVENQLIVELKAVEKLHPIHHAQVISYLKATGFILGLLLNFNVTNMNYGIKRVILSLQIFLAIWQFKQFSRLGGSKNCLQKG